MSPVCVTRVVVNWWSFIRCGKKGTEDSMSLRRELTHNISIRIWAAGMEKTIPSAVFRLKCWSCLPRAPAMGQSLPHPSKRQIMIGACLNCPDSRCHVKSQDTCTGQTRKAVRRILNNSHVTVQSNHQSDWMGLRTYWTSLFHTCFLSVIYSTSGRSLIPTKGLEPFMGG